MAKKKVETSEEVLDIIETNETVEETPVQAYFEQPQSEKMVPLSDVKRLIAEALTQQAEAKTQSIKPKRVTNHTAHVWRIDGKWVVDFVDRNNDPYVKTAVHAFNKFNEQTREFEAWIELKFHDGTTKELPLKRYTQYRTPIYCPIIRREKIDTSYVVGEVEKKKVIGDTMIGTGVMVDQEVTSYKEVFKIKTPDGDILTLNDYVLA